MRSNKSTTYRSEIALDQAMILSLHAQALKLSTSFVVVSVLELIVLSEIDGIKCATMFVSCQGINGSLIMKMKASLKCSIVMSKLDSLPLLLIETTQKMLPFENYERK